MVAARRSTLFDVDANGPANPLVRDEHFATAGTRKIDYILVRSGLHGPTLRVADCQRVRDHYGVVADLCLPRNRPGFQA